MHRSNLRCYALLLLSLLLSSTLASYVFRATPAVAIEPSSDWPSNFGGPQGQKRSHGEVPITQAELLWTVSEEDIGILTQNRVAARTTSVATAAGDFVALGTSQSGTPQDSSDDENVAFALSQLDGTVMWEYPGVAPDCPPAIGPDGLIYVLVTQDNESLLVPLSENGQAQDAVRRLASPATECGTNLLLSDGTHLFSDTTNLTGSGVVEAFNANGSSKWRTESAPAEEARALGSFVVSPDEKSFYRLVELSGAPALEARSVATGALLDRMALAGDGFPLNVSQNLLVLQGGDILVVTREADSDRYFLTRLSFDGTILQRVFDEVIDAFIPRLTLVDSSRDAVSYDLSVFLAGSNDVQVVDSPYGLSGVDDGETVWSVPVDPRNAIAAGGIVFGEAGIGEGASGWYAVGSGEDPPTPRPSPTPGEDSPTASPSPTSGVEESVRRVGSTSNGPVELAVEVCRNVAPNNDDARRVLIARVDEFADALAGATRAGSDGCILYTAGGADQTLDQATRVELDRVLPEGGEVELLGGTQAVSQAVQAELEDAGYRVRRYGGSTRFETAALIGDAVLAERPGTRMLLAYGYNWVDAVTGGAFGARTGIPVLLTGESELHPAVKEFAARHGVGETVGLGGQAVLSDTALQAAPGPSRVAGPNRHGTAVAVVTELWRPLLGNSPPSGFVLGNLGATNGWTAMLAGASLAAATSQPQLGLWEDAYPQETQQYLSGIDSPFAATVIGGDNWVRQSVVDQVAAEASS